MFSPSTCRFKGTGFPLQLLPEVVAAPALAGPLGASWHCVPQGTPVGVAMGDLQCSFIATDPSPSDAGIIMEA